MKACVFGGFILASYGIYMIGNPSANGIVLGSVMAALGLVGGFAIRGVVEDVH